MEKDLMVKISIRDDSFSHSAAMGSGGFNWPPDKFQYDRSDTWNDICLFTDNHILKNTVIDSKSRINIGLILEPYSTHPDLYHYVTERSVQNAYDIILTYNLELVKVNSAKIKYYPCGGCWIQPENRKIHNKNKLISIIASTKNSTYGHNLRHSVVKHLGRYLDIYGRGYNEIPNKELALNNYMYSVIIENDNNDGFFSEKLIDCLITGTIPIYWGSNVSDFFNTDGFILFNSLDELTLKLNNIKAQTYESKLHLIQENFQKAKLYTHPDNWIYDNILKDIVNNSSQTI